MKKIQESIRSTGWPICDRCKVNLDVKYELSVTEVP